MPQTPEEQEQLKNAHHRAKSYLENITDPINNVLYPQILRFKEDYSGYLKELRIASGVIAGALIALLRLDINKIDWLILLAVALNAIVIIFSFIPYKKQIIEEYPYALYLRKLIKKISELSGAAGNFINGRMDVTTFEEIEREVIVFAKRNDEFRKKEDHEPSIAQWYSEINLLSLIFALGIISTFLSVLLPHLYFK